MLPRFEWEYSNTFFLLKPHSTISNPIIQMLKNSYYPNQENSIIKDLLVPQKPSNKDFTNSSKPSNQDFVNSIKNLSLRIYRDWQRETKTHT